MNKVSHENKIAIWVCMDGDKKKWDIYGFQETHKEKENQEKQKRGRVGDRVMLWSN